MNVSPLSTRRQFLQVAATGAAVAPSVFPFRVFGPMSQAAQRARRTGSPALAGLQPVLFFDEYMVESRKRAEFTLNPAVKVANNPVIRGDRPWEGKTIAELCVLYDDQAKQFRMWYPVYDFHPPKPPRNIALPKGEQAFAELARKYKRCTACYAVSDDGIHWEKPALGLVEYQGSKDNNILMASGPHSRSHFSTGHLFIDPAEQDPARRFKGTKSHMIAGPGGKERMTIDLYYSGDGFDWTAYEHNPVFDLNRAGSWGPTSYLGWDPVRKVYAVYMENCGHQRCPVGKRLIGRSVSTDMIHWSQPDTVIVPDDLDGPRGELYALHPFVYEEYCVGMLWRFSEETQRHHPQFVFSRDGIRFDRRYREPFIPAGEWPEFDSSSILPVRPILHGDRVFIYYLGTNYRTAQQFDALGPGKAEWAVGLATVPRDRFVALATAPGAPGEVVTRTLVVAGDRLTVNMETAASGPSDVKVEVLDPTYFPIEGYTTGDAVPLVRSGLRNIVTWNASPDLSRLAGRPVKLRFHLRNAKLYSFQFAKA